MKLLSSLLALLAPFGLLVATSAQEGVCPPPLVISENAVSLTTYSSSRGQCTDSCNNGGFCCTLGFGGCDKVPCNTGCHIAFFSTDYEHCLEECARANNNADGASCTYTHERHSDVSPPWETSVETCVGSVTCGCPEAYLDRGWPRMWGDSNECSSEACEMGCSFANGANLSDKFFNGPDVVMDVRLDLDGDVLLSAIQDLTNHVNSVGSILTELEIDERVALFAQNAPLLESTYELIEATLNLIDNYEEKKGPLFMNSKTQGGFPRVPSSPDGKQLERAMLVVQQSALDQIFHGTLYDFMEGPRQVDSIVQPCTSLLTGRKWQTANYFPGFVDSPTDPTITYSVDINASMPECWGGPEKVTFCEQPSIRPLGLYLSPGQIATVILPQSMVGLDFKIQVGANTIDFNSKSFHLRMDRITTTFDVKDTITHVANPLGGGLYIRVPYLANLDQVTIQITGGVVQAPIFSKTSFKTTSEASWNDIRTAPGPWADFETDKILFQVPRIWMYNYDYSHVLQLMTHYDLAMDGVSELCGYRPEERNNYVLYESVDLDIKHGAYGIGYPQVNNLVQADANGPKASGPAGQSTHWLLTSPISDSTAYHELGHQQQQTRYRGETEAQVNLLITYVQNVKFGIPLDEAFIASFGGRTGIYTIDAAAIHWMVTENFRSGSEMDYSNSEFNQFRYQPRGYAKYADIARLFGWEAVSDFYRQEHLDFIMGNPSACPGLDDVDDRTFKMSLAAGADLTPLIHFWGIHPSDPQALKQCIEANNVLPSEEVKQQILWYKSIVPMDEAQFVTHFNEVFPNKKDCDCCESENYGCGWYNVWYPQWTLMHAINTTQAVLDIVDLYFPPTSDPSSGPSSAPSGLSSSQPSISLHPSSRPSYVPSVKASVSPSSMPSSGPSFHSSLEPTGTHSSEPSHVPSLFPSFDLSSNPSSDLSFSPSADLSSNPSLDQSSSPTSDLSSTPSSDQSSSPTSESSSTPSSDQSSSPTSESSSTPSSDHSSSPTSDLSSTPSSGPSSSPTSDLSSNPSSAPSSIPSSELSLGPSNHPSIFPSAKPSLTMHPSAGPSSVPSFTLEPSMKPSTSPSLQPSSEPSFVPSSGPSFRSQLTSDPSSAPSAQATDVPCGDTRSRCSQDSDCCSRDCRRGRCRRNRLRHLQGNKGTPPGLDRVGNVPPGLDRVGNVPPGLGRTGNVPPGLNRTDIRINLEKGRKTWKNKFVQKYDVELAFDFFGPTELLGPFVISVSGGKVQKVVYKETNSPVSEKVLYSIPTTIEEIFDLIHKESQQNIVALDVTYNPVRGNPEKVYLERPEGDAEEGAKILFVRNLKE